MCVLCGEFVMQVHWTDQARESEGDIQTGSLQRNRKRSRLHRALLCNQILSPYRLKIEDWQGSKFILTDAKGNNVIVHDLSHVWPAVEKLLGYPVNPLDPELLSRIRKS